MEEKTHIILASKLLNICAGNKNASLYSLAPFVEKKAKYFPTLYFHTLSNIPKVIDSSIELFTGKKTGIAKTAYEYAKIKEEKENLLKMMTNSLNEKSMVIPANKIEAALAILSHSYLDSFTLPVQFFLPYSSVCSGQWEFWDSIDFFDFREKLKNKEFIFNFREKLVESNVWKMKFKPDMFPLIVKRRLMKEKTLDKPLSPEAMIKAIIIRIGELAKPPINYEIIDFSIRSFFTYLGTKKYLRVDREIEFLRRLEQEIIAIFKKTS